MRRIEIGRSAISIADVEEVAYARAEVALREDPEYRRRIDAGPAFLDRLLSEDGVVYGVTTGYGDSCTVPVSPELIDELPVQLTRFHGCGSGRVLPVPETRAVMLARMVSLARGYSGVGTDLLDLLAELINRGITPLIPEEGSVGASGDLTPLSYLAAALIGEREVRHGDRTLRAADALREAGLSPHRLRPKESLALMNGTAVMTGLACLAFARCEYLCRLGSRITAMTTTALRGNSFHFQPELFELKPHVGQAQCAAWIHGDLAPQTVPRNSARLQDRYSIRCAPHIIGVLADALASQRTPIETELNSVNDNPIIDPERERVFHGGHFYGGHIAFAMDSLKNATANVCDMLDRQMALLVDTKFNNGLPQNLSGATGARASVNHGLKAVQISVSAWTAEALKTTMPASVFSRSTECHNQDKVSMGTIAARDCLRALELTEQTAAAVLFAASQALELRLGRGDMSESDMTPQLESMRRSVLSERAFVTEDRPLDRDLASLVNDIRAKAWRLYD